MTTPLDQLRFPIGEFHAPGTISSEDLVNWIGTIDQFPTRLATLLDTISTNQLTWKYRPDGWTIIQVIHHCADSHMNAFFRFKLSLTEVNPTIKPYDEAVWAELPDYKLPPFVSLELLKGVHLKWTTLLNSMTAIDFSKTYFHPEHQESFELKNAVGVYAWHCNHHFAHIEQALAAGGNY